MASFGPSLFSWVLSLEMDCTVPERVVILGWVFCLLLLLPCFVDFVVEELLPMREFGERCKKLREVSIGVRLAGISEAGSPGN